MQGELLDGESSWKGARRALGCKRHVGRRRWRRGLAVGERVGLQAGQQAAGNRHPEEISREQGGSARATAGQLVRAGRGVGAHPRLRPRETAETQATRESSATPRAVECCGVDMAAVGGGWRAGAGRSHACGRLWRSREEERGEDWGRPSRGGGESGEQ